KGMPRIAEEIVVSKHLELLNYAGGSLHFSRISTAKSVELIKAAKKKLKVSCDITTYQPLFDDSMLFDFDTNYKVNPPLHEKSDYSKSKNSPWFGKELKGKAVAVFNNSKHWFDL